MAQICLPPSPVLLVIQYQLSTKVPTWASGSHNGGGQLTTQHALQQPLGLFDGCINLTICQRRFVLELHGFC